MSNILTVRGELWNPACIDWTPVRPAQTIAGGVQVAAEFTVQCADGTLLHGAADDYLMRTVAGELIPVPRAIGLLLFQPIVNEVKP